jgi:ATP-dependent Clp protease ATP-binding subunit ClpA
LVAIFSEDDCHGVYCLKKQNISKLDVLNYIAHGISKTGVDSEVEEEEFEESEEYEEEEDEGEDEPRREKATALARFTTDLTEAARKGELDPIVGREKEIHRALKILARRQKNNPLFIGDPGVGKTAMANVIAQKIVAGEVPEALKDARLFSLNMGSVIAGTKFRGEFEDRLKALVKELSQLDNPILFIDEIHTIVGAGATGSGSMDAANLLKPALSSGKMRCIGSTTHEDFKKSFDKDRALSRRFSTIDISEPSIAETVEILEGLKERFEEYHQVKFAPEALQAAADLSARYINDRFLPDKAIDVIDEAGAENSLLKSAERLSTITELEIEKVVSSIARVPVKTVTEADQTLLQDLEGNLRKVVFGQDKAIAAISLAIKRSRANLTQPDKPVGCFLFAGPTGVGKTELAKALAHEMGVQFHRFDMSEYMEKHTVARLIGSPPGYVGYEDGGLLTDLIRKQPYSVLLLDEIEKAHEDIYNILLQVMDRATLTDTHGKKADFRNVILIMTTNAGSEKAASIGFGQLNADINRDGAIKKLFKPEFRNRLDETIQFQGLPIEIIEQIVDKFVKQLDEQLVGRKIKFTLDPAARTWFAKKGFDPVMGARPMARLIQKELKDPLADEILFGRLKEGGNVKIFLDGDKLRFEI